MPKLRADHQRLIVQRLATFTPPREIIAELRDRGVEVSPAQITYYDPSAAGTELASRWRVLHRETRDAFIADTSSIGISHRSYRLRELGNLYDRAKEIGDTTVASRLLQHAAREVGDMFTNKASVSVTSAVVGDAGDGSEGYLAITPVIGIYLPDNGRGPIYGEPGAEISEESS